MSDPRPNIVFILSDDHGYGDASSYGGPNIQTPNIDRIGAEGVRFTRFYANSPVCSPSRAALLTGRYPDLAGVPGVIRTDAANSWGYFDPAAITLPDKLSAAGYDTVHVGKWHLGLEPENHPCERGFGLFRGFLGDMMDDYENHRRHGINYMRHNHEEIDPAGHATDLFTEWAVETLYDHAKADQPFFLYLAYNAPHTPIQPTEAWLRKVREREPGISEQRARYVAMIEHMDAGIGLVLDTLKETGLARNTIVVYASDNGGQADVGAYNGPLRGAKQDMYEGGIRVPCCVRWPERIPAHQVSDHVALLMDFYPTLCEAAGVPITHTIEGRSFLPVLEGGVSDVTDRFLYWVRREGFGAIDQPYWGQDYHAVRQGDMKLLHNDPFSPLEFYDMAIDALETQDLIHTSHPAENELIRFMQEQIRQAGAVPWRKRESESSTSRT